jgi:hypothetical protein
MEISPGEWLHCLDSRTRQLRYRDAEHMVSRSMEQYLGLGGLRFPCIRRRDQSSPTQQDEDFLEEI